MGSPFTAREGKASEVQRTIFHVDMDAFYTSVEQRDHPEYQGKPVVVGADPREGRGRGVVAAASYEAREFGVHSAMPISRAYRLCPDAVYLRGNMKEYSRVSRRIMALFKTFTDLVEPISIDEAFLDVSRICRADTATALAREIKDDVWSDERLKASIGIAPNKFLAKIASDLDKPDGLVQVWPGREREFLKDLPVERLWGVGPKTAERLHRRGLKKIEDLWALDDQDMEMGKHGEHLLALARGIDHRRVVPHHEAKSVGHETTFSEDTDDPTVIKETLLKLSDAVAARLRRHGVKGRTVTLKYRDETFTTCTRSLTLPRAIDDAKQIFDAAMRQLDRVEDRGLKIRLLGVSLSKLGRGTDAGPDQLTLFDSLPSTGSRGLERSRGDEDGRRSRLNRAVDRLGERFGTASLKRASLLESEPLEDTIFRAQDDEVTEV